MSATLVLEFRVDGTATALQKVGQLQSGIEAAANRMNATWTAPLAGMESAIDRIGTKLETGLTRGFYAGAAAAGAFAFAMAAVGRSFIEVNQKFAEFEITLASSLKSLSAARAITTQVARVTALSPLPFKDIAESITGLSVLPQLNRKFADEARGGTLGQKDSMFMRSKELVEMMSTFRPDKRPEEAVFSIREALSGQWRSILRRFDVPLSIFSDAAGGKSIQRITAEGSDSIFNAIYKAFSNIISPEAVKQRAQMPAVALENIYEQMFQLPALSVGRSGVMKDIGLRLNKTLSDSQGFFGSDSQGGPSEFESKGYAKKMSDSLSSMLDSVMEGLTKVGESILGSFGYNGSGSIFDRAAKALSDGLSTFADRLPGYIDTAIDVGGDIVRLARELFDLFRKLAGWALETYKSLRDSPLGTGGAMLALYSAPSLIMSGVSGAMKMAISTFSAGFSATLMQELAPVKRATAWFSQLVTAGEVGGSAAVGAKTSRVTSEMASLAAQMGMVTSNGKALRAGQFTSAGAMSLSAATALNSGAAVEAAAGATTAAGAATWATAGAALAIVAAASYAVVKSFGEYREMNAAVTQEAKLKLEVDKQIRAGDMEMLAHRQAAQAAGGVAANPVIAGLNKDRSIAEGLIKNWDATQNYAYLEKLTKMLPMNSVPGEFTGSDAKTGVSTLLQPSAALTADLQGRVTDWFHRLIVAALKEEEANAVTKTAALIKAQNDNLSKALNYVSPENRLDQLGTHSAKALLGSSDSDTLRQKVSRNFQDSDIVSEGDNLRAYLTGVNKEVAETRRKLEENRRFLDSVVPAREMSDQFEQLSHMRAAIANNAPGVFGTMDKLTAAYKEMQAGYFSGGAFGIAASRGKSDAVIPSTNALVRLTEIANKTGEAALRDKLENAENVRFFKSKDMTANFIQNYAGTDSKAKREEMSSAFLAEMKDIEPNAAALVAAMSKMKSTIGMLPFDKLQTEVANAVTVESLYSKEVSELRAKYDLMGAASDNGKKANVDLTAAEKRLSDLVAKRSVAEQAYIDFIRQGTTQQALLNRDMAERVYHAAEAEGFTYDTATQRGRAETNAKLDWKDSKSRGFGEGFMSQFKMGDDFESLAQSGVDAANAIKGSFNSAFMDMLQGTQSVSQGFKSMALSILQSLQQVLIKMMAVWVMQQILGFVTSGVSASAGQVPASSAGMTGQSSLRSTNWGGKADGGIVLGGSGWKDDIPTMLMGGEYVLNKKATSMIGRAQLDAWNSGRVNRHFADGGYAGGYTGGGSMTYAPSSGTNVSVTVNYHSGSGGSRDEQGTGADEAERKAMKTMRQELEVMVVKVVEKHERQMKAQRN